MKGDGSRFKIENNILKGKEVSHPNYYADLGKFILDTLEDSPDFVGQIDAVTDEKYTYQKMRDRSVRCALWMRSQGLVSGDLVAICSHNQLDIAIPCFAALYLGVVFNPLDGAMNTKDIRHVMNITKPKMAFASEESARAVAEAAQQADLDVKIIVFGRMIDFFEFESVIGEPEVAEVRSFRCEVRDPGEIAAVLCSSGTTGLPKGVALSHGAILNQMHRSWKFSMTGHDCLIFSSLYWISGTLSLFMNLCSKVRRIVTPPFEEHLACRLVEKYEISWLLLGSSMVTRLLKYSALKGHDLSCVKYVCYGGAPLAPSSREALTKVVPNALIISVYGMTELGGLLSMQTENSKPNSCGEIIENSQLKVVDMDTGRILGANRSGELLLKSTSMMSYYYGNPGATAVALDEEGWLHSGDLGYYDEDGEVFVVDRIKQLIKYRGYHVSPVEIETVILSCPEVKEVAVVGITHPIDDEHPVAFVVRATDSTHSDRQVTEKELVDLVDAQLSDSKRLRGGVRFIEHLPKTPSDKVRLKELRDMAANLC